MATAVLTNGVSRLEVDLDDDCNSLEQILDTYRDTLNIPADATIAVDGEVATDLSATVEDGAEISATKQTGAKG